MDILYVILLVFCWLGFRLFLILDFINDIVMSIIMYKILFVLCGFKVIYL